MKKIVLLLIVLLEYSLEFSAQVLPCWEKGELDIHHINTGRGDATFFILPDGTTLLLDAGANNRTSERTVKARPNELKSPGEWMNQYIGQMIPNGKHSIDYYLMTHYHSDHIDGISAVYQTYPCRILIDRGDVHMAPSLKDRDTTYYVYRRLVDRLSGFVRRESFNVGSDKQIVLAGEPHKYDSVFSVRNLYANGTMWDGSDSIRSLFPTRLLLDSDMPRENMYSCAIKLSYGKFDYYTGGDIPGYPRPGRPQWHDVETPLAKVIGPVEVAVANHHGNGDGTNECFVATLAPQNFIISTWDALHPEHKVLYRMFSKELYPGKRNVFATNIHPATKIVIGELVDKMASQQGHIVVRVLPGGEQYTIYVLDDTDDSYRITASFGPFTCK